MVNIVNRVIDLYGGDVGASPAVDKALRRIQERIKAQLKLQEVLVQLQGMAQMILGGR